MISTFSSVVFAALPLAVAVLPVFVAVLIAAMIVSMATRALPVADGPRETIQRITGMLQKISLTCLALLFLTLFAATNMAALTAKQTFESFQAEQTRR